MRLAQPLPWSPALDQPREDPPSFEDKKPAQRGSLPEAAAIPRRHQGGEKPGRPPLWSPVPAPPAFPGPSPAGGPRLASPCEHQHVRLCACQAEGGPCL